MAEVRYSVATMLNCYVNQQAVNRIENISDRQNESQWNPMRSNYTISRPYRHHSKRSKKDTISQWEPKTSQRERKGTVTN